MLKEDNIGTSRNVLYTLNVYFQIHIPSFCKGSAVLVQYLISCQVWQIFKHFLVHTINWTPEVVNTNCAFSESVINQYDKKATGQSLGTAIVET